MVFELLIGLQARIINSKNLNCDNIFVFNKHIIQEYKKYIKSNYHILGNFKNNIEIKQTKLNNNFCISQYNKTDKKFINFQIDLKLLNLYFIIIKKIYILLKTKFFRTKKKLSFIKIFKSNCVFKSSE